MDPSQTRPNDSFAGRRFSHPALLQSLLTLALLATVFWLSSNRDFYDSSMIDVFMALALGATLITLLVVQPSWMNLISVLALSSVLAGIDYRWLGFQPKFMALFSFAGLSSLAMLGVRTIWSRAADRRVLVHAFLPSVLFAASEYTASTMLDITEKLHPKTFDLYLYSFDCSLRVQFGFLMGQVFGHHPWFRFAGLLFYIALPLPLALVYAALLRRKSGRALPAMLAFLVTGPLGVIFYNMVPATGPVHVFGPNFPWHPLPIAQAAQLTLQTIPVQGARNALPSLHMAWVLLIWWNSRGLSRWIRAVALAFVSFTIFATLGTGEHYFVDLVVAFPFALMVQALCSYSHPVKYGARRAALLFGTFTSLAWMALVSFGTSLFWISPMVPWLMVIATVSMSTFLIARLQNAEPADQSAQDEIVPQTRAASAAG